MSAQELERWLDVEFTRSRDAVLAEELEVPATDGVALAGTLFRPAAGGEVAGTVTLNGGTGIPRGFYGNFARHLASRGLATLVYDYRGTAGSAPKRLRGYDADKITWVRRDMSGAFAWLGERFPGAPRFVVGHSVGGQMLGLLEDVERIDGIVTVAASFGYWGHMPRPYRYVVAALWYAAIPAATAVFGYFPARRLGLGEDIPAGVARQWARWGKRADYFTHDPALTGSFERVTAPWKALLIADDAIATPDNAQPLLDLYARAELDVETLVPEDEGYDAIGHLGFFSRSRHALWSRVDRYLLDL